MSCIINVEKTDLSIKQANFRKIINAFKREAMINEDFTEFEDIRSIAEILDILGLPYYTVLNNDDEEEYIIKEHSEEFRELYCFERGLQLIAENLENTERYTLIINSNEYQEKYKNKIKISMHRNEKFENSDTVCPAGETFFYIDPQGYVSPCSWIKKMDKKYTSKQSLKNATFQEIIDSDEIQIFNKLKYERIKKYGTGCLAICMERNNTYFSKDPLLEKEDIKSEDFKCLSVSSK